MKMNTRTLVMTAMLAAIASVLMFLDFPLPFFPVFLKLDFSELPAIIGAFAFGPLAGVAIELVKSLLHLTRTSTGGVGELAAFIIGTSYVLPAGLIYRRLKSYKGAVISLVAGIIIMTAAGAAANFWLIIPFYSNVMPMEKIVSLCAAIIPAVKDIKTIILFTIVPFNLFKGSVISLLTFIVYKRISPFLHKEKRILPTK